METSINNNSFNKPTILIKIIIIIHLIFQNKNKYINSIKTVTSSGK